MLPREMGQGT